MGCKKNLFRNIMAVAIFKAFICVCMMQGIKGYVESHCLHANHPGKRPS
jgi:hypothetical protein